MAKRCQVTGKTPKRGKSYSLRGIAKKKRGIGLKVTGIKRRRFSPNLKKKRFYLVEEGRSVSLKVTPHGMGIIDKVGIRKVLANIAAGKTL